MNEWDMNVQRIIDLAEYRLRGELTLEEVSRRLGYSPWYCTRQFSRVMGMSLRSYLRIRRMTEAAIALRDGDRGILDVAIEFGFSSQEAFTRAFQDAWGINPGAWRAAPRPLPFMLRRPACCSWSKGGTMEIENREKGEGLKKARGRVEISLQTTPPCRFVGLFLAGASDYFDFWGKMEGRGVDCRVVEGLLASLIANAQIGGWFSENGASGYIYGVELPADWRGGIPDGMRLMDIGETEYMVFRHPPYDYEAEDEAVFMALGEAMREYDFGARGLKPRADIPTWQRHDPGVLGQAWCRPVHRIK